MLSKLPAIINDVYTNIKKTDLDDSKFKDLRQKIETGEKLSLEEVGLIFLKDDDDLDQILFTKARNIKEEVYGRRIVLFAPLYLSNYCINNCSYCSFRNQNQKLTRIRLTLEQAVNEAKVIRQMGHTRILLVMGEEPEDVTLKYLEEIIPAIYSNVDIRRMNVNIAPLSLKGFKRLKNLKIGTYQLFQETYNPELYQKVHLSGPKKDFFFRLSAVERAIEAGIDDIGLGALFGLGDPLFELLAIITHAKYLKEKYGIGPHTVSVPRLKPAVNSLFFKEYKISDHKFKKIVALLRVMLPYTGIILSTRESPKLRDELVDLGVSQMSAASKTGPGEYGQGDTASTTQQFLLSDHRSLEEIISILIKKGYLPSFCTACYRSKRTGKIFMELADQGKIKEFCTPNALLSFSEYLYEIKDKNPEIYHDGQKFLQDAIKNLPYKKILQGYFAKILSGKKDVYL